MYSESTILGIECGSWTGQHRIDFSKLGVSKTVLSKFKRILFNGGVRLITTAWKNRIHAASQKLRSFPETKKCGFKFSKSTTEYMVPNRAMEAFKAIWRECLAEYNEVILEFKAQYASMKAEMRRQHRSFFKEIYLDHPDLGQDFLKSILAEIEKSYPDVWSIDERYKARLVPNKLMAMCSLTSKGKQFHTKLDAMGAEDRNAFIAQADIDSRLRKLGDQAIWRQQIKDGLQTLKEQGEKGKLKGQTVNSVRLFLTRHPLMDYFGEGKVCSLLEELTTILPEENYGKAKPEPILAMISQIEDALKKGEKPLAKKTKQAQNLKRKIKIF
jgi:hypothetical protein